MLQSLHIRNFAIIEDVTLEFGSGLNILSGETGAGKSIIIQALSLLMGERGRSDWIRKGEDAAVVSGLFDLSAQSALSAKLQEWQVPGTDGELLVQRTLSRNGRNQVRFNGMPATVAMLTEMADPLVAIVSQKEHEWLLRPEVQRELLDQFGGLEARRAGYQETLQHLSALEEKWTRLQSADRESRQQEEFLRFQLEEIREANPQAHEDETLKAEKGRIKYAAQLGAFYALADELLSAGEENVTGRLAQLETQMARLTEADPALAELLPVLQTAQAQLDEVARCVGAQQSALDVEPERLDAIESRLAELDRLKRKYGGSVDSILATAETLHEQLGGLENFEEQEAALTEQRSAAAKELQALDKKLQAARAKVATRLAREVEKELADLGLEQAQFTIEFEPITSGLVMAQETPFDRFGSQRAVFYLVANPGEDPKPLARIASGGERSRILLAIKKVLVEFANQATSVFDEVDEGVGGMNASKIGEKLAEIAQQRQVICITHRPQIAAFADQHFVIEKEFAKNRTKTQVRPLDAAGREHELARMLAGKRITDQARQHARDLIKGRRLP